MNRPELLKLVEQHTRAGRFAQADDVSRQTLETASDQAGLLKELGTIALRAGRLAAAMELFEQAIIDNACPDPESHVGLGMSLLQQNRLVEAEQQFLFALDLDPKCPQAHEALSSLILPGKNYYDYLARFHQWLKPATYVEIGIEAGDSLALARPPTVCLGIDPKPQIRHKLTVPTKVAMMTSDDFFASKNLSAELGRATFDLAFVDGLHHFDAALMDFINLEVFAARNSIILFHDCFPINKATSTRDRETKFWSGDTWKVILCLKAYRPDLAIFTIATPPTGLGVVTNLNPQSTVLKESFPTILDQYLGMDYDHLGNDKQSQLNVVKNDWAGIQALLMANGCRPFH